MKQHDSSAPSTTTHFASDGVGPIDRREQFMVGLLSSTDDESHVRVIESYRKGRSVKAAEDEVRKIIDEIINED